MKKFAIVASMAIIILLFHFESKAQKNIFPDSGNVGIGTTTPACLLDLEGGAVLFNGFAGQTPISGSGSRFMWVPNKSALRAGVLSTSAPNFWDDPNIGPGSVAFGSDVKATGNSSIAMGYNSYATGGVSIALGLNSMAGSGGSTAIGTYVNCTGAWSHTIGSGVFGGPSLTNNITNSLVVGYNSDIPTLFVGPSAGVGTTGNVGIGNAFPSYKLDVTGTISATGLKLGSSSTPGFVLTTDAFGNASWAAPSGGSSAGGWTTTGNNLFNTNAGGAIGINCTNIPTGYMLSVNGDVRARKIRVDSEHWCDYVFADGYYLKPIKELEAFIKTYKHLPEIPTTTEVKAEGIDLADMDAKLLKKVEELTLYIIELEKRIEDLEKK